MGHVVLWDTRFFIFSNELWVQELACDILAGAYARQFDLATGKYKSVIDKVVSPTHPAGAMRIKAVEFGFENGFETKKNEDLPDTNLLKQAVLRIRKEKENQQNEQNK